MQLIKYFGIEVTEKTDMQCMNNATKTLFVIDHALLKIFCEFS